MLRAEDSGRSDSPMPHSRLSCQFHCFHPLLDPHPTVDQADDVHALFRQRPERFAEGAAAGPDDLNLIDDQRRKQARPAETGEAMLEKASVADGTGSARFGLVPGTDIAQ